MEIIELLLIIVGCLALVVAIATAIIKVSSFYRTQFGFSVWSGVLLLFLAFVLMLIYYGGEKPQSILLPILSAGLCAFTIVRNICLAGWGYGCLGMLFQGVMTLLLFFVLLFFVVIIAIAGLLARATTRGTNRMSGICSGVSQEIRYAIILLPVFILKR